MSVNLATSLLLVVATAVGAGGCTVLDTARRVAYDEPKVFADEEDKEISLATYRSWGERVFRESGAYCPESLTAADYAWGFREGFAQYVFAGGSGDPPAMPPRHYWQSDFRNAEGAIAVKSWFEGYRRGAEAARLGGYREKVTLRLSASLLDCDECGCPEREKTGGCDCSLGGPRRSEALPTLDNGRPELPGEPTLVEPLDDPLDDPLDGGETLPIGPADERDEIETIDYRLEPTPPREDVRLHVRRLTLPRFVR